MVDINKLSLNTNDSMWKVVEWKYTTLEANAASVLYDIEHGQNRTPVVMGFFSPEGSSEWISGMFQPYPTEICDTYWDGTYASIEDINEETFTVRVVNRDAGNYDAVIDFCYLIMGDTIVNG